MTTITFIATRKNLDRSERELYEMDVMIRALGFKRSFLDLGIHTVMACTPPTSKVRFVDEYLEDIDYSIDSDVIALSAKTSCVTRAYEVADEFRRRKKTVILGGIHPSLRPDEALRHADSVVTGEAESIWPSVVRDLESKKLRERYDANGFPEMAKIPVPAWNHGPANQYLFHQLQTTRGCPFRCRFCSVPDISGQDFALYLQRSDRLLRLKREQTAEIQLNTLEAEVATIVALDGDFAALGLSDKLNGGAAVLSSSWQDGVHVVELADGGEFLAFSERAPSHVEVDGSAAHATWAAGRLTLQILGAGRHRLCFHFPASLG